MNQINRGILQEFLEGDIQLGLIAIKKLTDQLTNAANNMMDSVSDIVLLTRLDDNEVQESVRDAGKRRDDTVDDLIEFDHSQRSALTSIANDLMIMERWIIDIESVITEGLTDVNFPAEF